MNAIIGIVVLGLLVIGLMASFVKFGLFGPAWKSEGRRTTVSRMATNTGCVHCEFCRYIGGSTRIGCHHPDNVDYGISPLDADTGKLKRPSIYEKWNRKYRCRRFLDKKSFNASGTAIGSEESCLTPSIHKANHQQAQDRNSRRYWERACVFGLGSAAEEVRPVIGIGAQTETPKMQEGGIQ